MPRESHQYFLHKYLLWDLFTMGMQKFIPKINLKIILHPSTYNLKQSFPIKIRPKFKRFCWSVRNSLTEKSSSVLWREEKGVFWDNRVHYQEWVMLSWKIWFRKLAAYCMIVPAIIIIIIYYHLFVLIIINV